jgi:hypothetical protein
VNRIRLALAPCLLALALPGAVAQSLYKCTSPGGRVTYQETPCLGERSQKRLDAPRPPSREELEARRALENEALWGNELAGRFAREAREREIARQREREALAREERLRRQLEEANRPVEDIPWNPPWGFPGKPGQARPTPRPTS